MNKNIQPVPPSDSVEVHLPDGSVLSGPRGTCVGDFLQAAAGTASAPLMAAIVNTDLRELTYPVQMEARISPVTMADPDGARIYRRSLTFLLGAAFANLFPGNHMTIDHSVSSGGYFCQVTDRPPLDSEELASLDHYMRTCVEKDERFCRAEVSLEEAKAYFESKGYHDKVRLLNYRQKDYVTLYQLDDYRDYHQGYMVPSTGYLKWFEIVLAGDGFILHYPRQQAPTSILPLPEYPKLLASFRQYGEWLERLGIESVGALNDAIQEGRSREVILVSEALHEQNIAEIAQKIARRGENARVVLIAGPSSSGKTTFSRRLAVQLLALGLSPFALELDNFFVDREKTPLGEDGQYDFEALEALDLNLLGEDLSRLIAGEAVNLPKYNFKSGKRETGETVQLGPEHIIILEGIHGLDPRLVPASVAARAYRVYVSALTQLNLDRHNRVSTTDTRLIRRIVRDTFERGYTAIQTISGWESVGRGEKKYIFPYQENADAMFNSALVYELSALKPLAEPILLQVPHGTPEYIEAKRLLAFLEWFLPLDADLIPDNSILREFVGGSILKDFTVWKA
ncbi:MAG TPA: nucleoside kinase [Anaerolineales bacterium]|nr:nucleoside kinase [Anaerolineales bacterium]